MKTQYSLLNNCYYQMCLDSDPSVFSSQHHSKSSLDLPIKRERISLKRSFDINECTIKGAKSFKARTEDQQTRTESDKLDCYKLGNIQTMASTHRFEQEKPQYSDRIISTYSRRYNVGSNESSGLNNVKRIGSQEKLDLLRSKKQTLGNGKMENVRSQPNFIRRIYNFQGMVALLPVAESKAQSLATVSRQSQKKASRYELKQESGHKRTVTIQSIVSETVGPQRIEQSMVEIDFFHPSTRRLLDLEN